MPQQRPRPPAMVAFLIPHFWRLRKRWERSTKAGWAEKNGLPFSSGYGLMPCETMFVSKRLAKVDPSRLSFYTRKIHLITFVERWLQGIPRADKRFRYFLDHTRTLRPLLFGEDIKLLLPSRDKLRPFRLRPVQHRAELSLRLRRTPTCHRDHLDDQYRYFKQKSPALAGLLSQSRRY